MKQFISKLSMSLFLLVSHQSASAQSSNSLDLSLSQNSSGLMNRYQSINFSSRLTSEVCGQVIQQLTELGINRTQDHQLNQILNSIAVECGLGKAETQISSKPVMYVFLDSDLKILWDGRSLSVNERAEMTLRYTMPSSFNNIIEISKTQIEAPEIKNQKGILEKSEASADLGILDRLAIKTKELMSGMRILLTDGEPHVIISGIAHHDRNTYTREQIAKFNEKAWGIGFESVKINQNGNREAVAAMVVRDSHFDPQLSISYEWQKALHITKNIKLWGGYTAGVISRSDYGYFPIPFALPTVGISLGKLNLKTVIIPSFTGASNGNVLFIFASIPLKN